MLECTAVDVADPEKRAERVHPFYWPSSGVAMQFGFCFQISGIGTSKAV